MIFFIESDAAPWVRRVVSCLHFNQLICIVQQNPKTESRCGHEWDTSGCEEMWQGEQLTHSSCCDFAGLLWQFPKSVQGQTGELESPPRCAGVTQAAITMSAGKHVLNLYTHQIGIKHKLKSPTCTSCWVVIFFKTSTCSCVLGVMDKTWSLELQEVPFRKHCRSNKGQLENKC